MTPLGIFYLIILISVVAFRLNLVMQRRKLAQARKPKALPKDELKGVSWAGRQIVKAYQSIPEANQPGYDIVDVVKALDVKYDKALADAHFVDNLGYANWTCFCRRVERRMYAPTRFSPTTRKCEFEEYRALYNDIQSLKASLDAQEHALKVAGVAGSLENAKSLTERLRQERELVEQVTKELM